MKNKCLRAIEQYSMLSAGDTVVVGVSGGADSMALLHFLHSHRNELKINVIAAHFNHGIRGNEADRDMEFVRSFCKLNNIEFVCKTVDVPSAAVAMHLGTEECSRVLRYEFLQSVVSDAKIATAHTNSDSCESFLFNFARGTGMQGLCGIPATRENIIRPCIFCSAQDTRNYCIQNEIEWCEDSTNKSQDYSRNRIRQQTVPSLKSVNDKFEDNALRCMQILQSDHDYLQSAALAVYEECKTGKYSIDFSALLKQHRSIVTRVLLHFVRTCGCKDVSMKQIDSLQNADNGDVLTLSDAVRFKLENGTLSLIEEYIPVEPVSIAIDVFNRDYPFFDSVVSVRMQDFENISKSKYKCTVDADKICSAVLRNRRSGDKLRIAQRNCTKTLKQLFAEHKIPVEKRQSWPVIADEKGVIWCAEFGVDESRLPDHNTKKVMIIEWRKPI